MLQSTSARGGFVEVHMVLDWQREQAVEMESWMSDNCHQKSFPITCQAFRALRLTDSHYPWRIKNLARVVTCTKDDSIEAIPVGIPIVFVFVPRVWGPHGKPKVKIPRAPTYLSCFNICEAPRCARERNVQQNTLGRDLSGYIWSRSLTFPWLFPVWGF